MVGLMTILGWKQQWHVCTGPPCMIPVEKRHQPLLSTFPQHPTLGGDSASCMPAGYARFVCFTLDWSSLEWMHIRGMPGHMLNALTSIQSLTVSAGFSTNHLLLLLLINCTIGPVWANMTMHRGWSCRHLQPPRLGRGWCNRPWSGSAGGMQQAQLLQVFVRRGHAHQGGSAACGCVCVCTVVYGCTWGSCARMHASAFQAQ